MASTRGRPKKEDGDQGTRQVRIHADLADMIGWIVEVEGGTVAGTLDPIIRPQIETLYQELLPEIELKKKGEAEAEKLKQARKAAQGG